MYMTSIVTLMTMVGHLPDMAWHCRRHLRIDVDFYTSSTSPNNYLHLPFPSPTHTQCHWKLPFAGWPFVPRRHTTNADAPFRRLRSRDSSRTTRRLFLLVWPTVPSPFHLSFTSNYLLEQLRASSSQSTSTSTSTSASRANPSRPADALSSLDSTSTSTPTSSAGFSLARGAIGIATDPRREQAQRQMLLDASRGWDRGDLERQAVHRRWKAGDVYAPHDLTGAEMAKWKKARRRPKPKVDVVDSLGLKPIDHYKNFAMMSEYMTEMGRIKHSNETNLRPVNQRRMAKAVRRAIGVGILMPSTHRHPEILRMEMNWGTNRTG